MSNARWKSIGDVRQLIVRENHRRQIGHGDLREDSREVFVVQVRMAKIQVGEMRKRAEQREIRRVGQRERDERGQRVQLQRLPIELNRREDQRFDGRGIDLVDIQRAVEKDQREKVSLREEVIVLEMGIDET